MSIRYRGQFIDHKTGVEWDVQLHKPGYAGAATPISVPRRSLEIAWGQSGDDPFKEVKGGRASCKIVDRDGSIQAEVIQNGTAMGQAWRMVVRYGGLEVIQGFIRSDIYEHPASVRRPLFEVSCTCGLGLLEDVPIPQAVLTLERISVADFIQALVNATGLSLPARFVTTIAPIEEPDHALRHVEIDPRRFVRDRRLEDEDGNLLPPEPLMCLESLEEALADSLAQIQQYGGAWWIVQRDLYFAGELRQWYQADGTTGTVETVTTAMAHSDVVRRQLPPIGSVAHEYEPSDMGGEILKNADYNEVQNGLPAHWTVQGGGIQRRLRGLRRVMFLPAAPLADGQDAFEQASMTFIRQAGGTVTAGTYLRIAFTMQLALLEDVPFGIKSAFIELEVGGRYFDGSSWGTSPARIEVWMIGRNAQEIMLEPPAVATTGPLTITFYTVADDGDMLLDGGSPAQSIEGIEYGAVTVSASFDEDAEEPARIVTVCADPSPIELRQHHMGTVRFGDGPSSVHQSAILVNGVTPSGWRRIPTADPEARAELVTRLRLMAQRRPVRTVSGTFAGYLSPHRGLEFKSERFVPAEIVIRANAHETELFGIQVREDGLAPTFQTRVDRRFSSAGGETRAISIIAARQQEMAANLSEQGALARLSATLQPGTITQLPVYELTDSYFRKDQGIVIIDHRTARPHQLVIAENQGAGATALDVYPYELDAPLAIDSGIFHRQDTLLSLITQTENAVAITVQDIERIEHRRGLNLLDNGDFEGGATNWSAIAAKILPGDAAVGTRRFRDDASTSVESDSLITVDTSREYTVSGYSRRQEGGGLFYLGLAPYDADGNRIIHRWVHAVQNTETTITVHVEGGSTEIELGSEANWEAGTHRYIAFEIENDGSDLPNKNLFGPIESISGNVLTLANPLPAGTSYDADTKVRMHIDASTYMYTGALAAQSPATWQHYSGQVKGVQAPYEVPGGGKFWIGTRSVRAVMITNLNESGPRLMEVDGIVVAESVVKRITDAEASITVLSDEIALRVTQAEFSDLHDEVMIHESLINQNADQIALRVTQTTFDSTVGDLDGRVTANEAEIAVNAGQIALNVSTLETHGADIDWSIAQIQLHADEIALRVTQTAFNELDGRVSTAEGQITVNADQIELRVKTADLESYFQLLPDAAVLSTQVFRSPDWNGTVDDQGNITEPGTSGWAISKAGDASFNSVFARDYIHKDEIGDVVPGADDVYTKSQADARFLRYDGSQNLTSNQKDQARANLSISSTDTITFASAHLATSAHANSAPGTDHPTGISYHFVGSGNGDGYPTGFGIVTQVNFPSASRHLQLFRGNASSDGEGGANWMWQRAWGAEGWTTWRRFVTENPDGRAVLSAQANGTSHAVRADRQINTGSSLIGGGNLTANRTIDTVQDIRTTASPRFERLGLGSPAGATLEILSNDATVMNVTAQGEPFFRLSQSAGWGLIQFGDLAGLGSDAIASFDAETGVFSLENTGLHLDQGDITVWGPHRISSSSFASGFAGHGARMHFGDASAEVNDLTVRNQMRVYELLINQIRATNGSVFVSSTGRVESVSFASGTYTINTGEDTFHGFLENDLIRAQRFTGVDLFQSNMRVTAVTSGTQFQAVLINGAAPQPGFEYVRLGNTTNANRRGSVYLTADDAGAPFIDIVDGIAAHSDWNQPGFIKTRLGRLSGVVDPDFGSLSGYGLWATNAYLKGGIWASFGNISGFSIAGNRIHKNNIEIHSDGRIRHTADRWRFNNDGSWLLANGKMSGDSAGNLFIDQAARISWADLDARPGLVAPYATYDWREGVFPSGWSVNGATPLMTVLQGPDGRRVVVARGNPQVGTDAGGGMNRTGVSMDVSHKHMYTVYFRKTHTGSTSGIAYFGCGPVRNIDATPNSNPYFWFGHTLPDASRWYLLVGFIHPFDGFPSGHEGGVYDVMTGEKVATATDFVHDDNFSTNDIRAFIWYGENTSSFLYIYRPQIFVVDGTEPRLDDLLGLNRTKLSAYLLSSPAIKIGSGNSVFRADTTGIWLGHDVFASAPFSVTPQGALVATTGVIGGATIDGTEIRLNDNLTLKSTPAEAYVCAHTDFDNFVSLYRNAGFAGLVARKAGVIELRIGTGQNLIAGHTFDHLSIYAGLSGMSSQGASDSSIRFWAGSDFAGRSSAPFRVQNDGGVIATRVTMSYGEGFSSTGWTAGPDGIELFGDSGPQIPGNHLRFKRNETEQGSIYYQTTTLVITAHQNVSIEPTTGSTYIKNPAMDNLPTSPTGNRVWRDSDGFLRLGESA